MAEENDKEAADMRRSWVVRGVGNLGEVEGECELVLEVGVMCELVGGRCKVKKVAGDEDSNAMGVVKLGCSVVDVEKEVILVDAKVMHVD